MTPHTNHFDHHGRARHRAADLTAMTRAWASDGTVRAFMFAPYQVGAFVVPTDLPREFVCQIAEAYAVEGTPLQVLELRHFDGPWPRSTRLVRGGDWVRPAVASEVVELLAGAAATRCDRNAGVAGSVSPGRSGCCRTAPRAAAARRRHAHQVEHEVPDATGLARTRLAGRRTTRTAVVPAIAPRVLRCIARRPPTVVTAELVTGPDLAATGRVTTVVQVHTPSSRTEKQTPCRRDRAARARCRACTTPR